MYSRSMKGLDSKVSLTIDQAKMNKHALVDSDDIDLSDDESVTEDDTADTTCRRR